MKIKTLIIISILFSSISFGQTQLDGVGIIRLGKSIELIKELETLISIKLDSLNNDKNFYEMSIKEKTITKLKYDESLILHEVYNCDKLQTYYINGYNINGLTLKNITLCFYNKKLAYINFQDVLSDLIIALYKKYPNYKSIWSKEKVICPNNTTKICDWCTNYETKWFYKTFSVLEYKKYYYSASIDTEYNGKDPYIPCDLKEINTLTIESNYYQNAIKCHKEKQINLEGL